MYLKKPYQIHRKSNSIYFDYIHLNENYNILFRTIIKYSLFRNHGEVLKIEKKKKKENEKKSSKRNYTKLY